MSSSTSSSKLWLRIFFVILIASTVGVLAASEWLIRAEVLRADNFEWIAARLRDSTQSNAAFGDSHVAAVPDYNTNDFVNLGVGATTIRKMDQRVRYYFERIKPGLVIIQADPHLFADYRLEAQGSYVPETYSEYRLRAFDPQHRGFMLNYWITLFAKGQIKAPEAPDYDELWRNANRLQDDAPKPAEQASPPPAAAVKPAAGETPSLPETTRPSAQTPPAEATKPLAVATKAPAEATKGPAEETKPKETTEAPETAAQPAGDVAQPSPSPAAVLPATASATPDSAKGANDETLAKFNAFMDYEVSAHTPVLNFRERNEATIYRELIKYLIARGAKVCLMNYPVDKFYRDRADAIPAYAAVHRFYQEVARENHIPYVSFWARFDDPSMYQNTDHVNHNGSIILAREAREACFGKPAS